MTDVPDGLRRLAERQYGLASTGQASAWLDRAALRQLRYQGVLTPFGRNVVRFAGTERSWRQRAMGACLGYGDPVALSHQAAARILGWGGLGQPPLSVVLPHVRSGRRQGVATHRVLLPAEDIVTRLGLPATSPARTLLDLSSCLPERYLEDLYDHLMRTEGLRAPEILARLPARADSPAHRLHQLHRLSQRRIDQATSSESHWEDRLAGWLVDAGLPQPERQHQVALAGTVYLLDLAYPKEMVAVEFDGWQWHRSRRSFDSDRARSTELAIAGWLAVQVTSAHGQSATVRRVEQALLQRGWRPA